MAVAGWWTKLVGKAWDYLVLDDPVPTRSPSKSAPSSIAEAVDKARAEWQAARLYFENVTDPDLVDHAIYMLEAAERKYMYLLRHAEEFGYPVNPDDKIPAGARTVTTARTGAATANVAHGTPHVAPQVTPRHEASRTDVSPDEILPIEISTDDPPFDEAISQEPTPAVDTPTTSLAPDPDVPAMIEGPKLAELAFRDLKLSASNLSGSRLGRQD